MTFVNPNFHLTRAVTTFLYMKASIDRRFSVRLAVPEWTTNTELVFRLNATTLSTELAPEDNVARVQVEVKNMVSTTFRGYVLGRNSAFHTATLQWTVQQMSIMIIYNSTWSILIQ